MLTSASLIAVATIRKVPVITCALILCTLFIIVGSYILASNIVEFNIPTYLGLYPSFLVAATRL